MITLLILILLILYVIKFYQKSKFFKKKVPLNNLEDFIISKLNHVNIVKLLKIKKINKNKILYLKDEHLLPIKNYQPNIYDINNEKKVKYIALQILNALQHIHSKNIIHNDIHPNNILFDPKSKKIVVIDFNVSLIGEQIIQNKRKTDLNSHIFYYTAPEKMNLDKDKRIITNKVDIYSAGAIIYVLLTGSTLYSLERPSIVKQKIKSIKNYSGINFSLLDNYSKECIDLLKNMLAYNPKLRISAKEALEHNWFKSD